MQNQKLENVGIAIGMIMLMLFGAVCLSVSVILVTNDSLTSDGVFFVTRVAICVSTIGLMMGYYNVFNENPLCLNKVSPKMSKVVSGLVVGIAVGYYMYLMSQPNISSVTRLFIVGFMLTSIAEELMFRGVIEHQLRKSFSFYQVVFIQALMFALLGHQAFELTINLLVRFPLGVILSLVKNKTQLYVPGIMLHWIYDTCMFTL